MKEPACGVCPALDDAIPVMSNEISRDCVEFALGLRLGDIPDSVLLQARRCLLDWLGCALRGARTAEGAIICRHVAMMGGHPQATVFGLSQRSSVCQAALANGYSGHILEFDDVDKSSISHPGTVVIPAALACGEWRGMSGADLLVALVAGYEVMLRVGAAVTPGHYSIWHTTATAGVFGSAIAAGLALKLGAEPMRWAFGNAGTMAAGLWEFLHDGAMSKYLHAGRAAANGVLAACLAEEGLTGAQRILEGPQGFFAGYARQVIDPTIFEDFGSRYRTAGVSFKPYPCCRHTHPAIDCALAAAANAQIQPEQVARIRLMTYDAAMQVAGNESAATPRQAAFSLKFCVASAFLFGRPTLKSFEPSSLESAPVRALMAKIEVVSDPEFNRITPAAWPARLTVVLHDGSSFEVEGRYPKGDPENPLSWEDAKEKFRSLVEGMLSQTQSENIIHACEDIENLQTCTAILKGAEGHE